jgi:hypothetical protein
MLEENSRERLFSIRQADRYTSHRVQAYRNGRLKNLEVVVTPVFLNAVGHRGDPTTSHSDELFDHANETKKI